jgi:Protein kinase domain
MSAPRLPTGAKVPITMTSKFGDFSTTVTLGECLGSGGSASAYRISATTNDRQIQTDGSMTHLTDLVLRLEFQLTDRMKERQEAINFLEERRATDPHLTALVPLYASGDGTSTRVAECEGRQMALSVQLLKFAGKDLSKDMPVDGLGWTRTCIGMAGVAHTLDQLHFLKWVHRDISPNNLFTGFPQTPTSPFLVGDLGIITKANQVRPTTVASDGTTTLTQAWSKGAYTPPEVLRAWDDDGYMRVTEYLDVWQLATTMTELATGRLPFRGWDHSGGQALRRQSAYTSGVLSGRYDRDVIKDAPPALRQLLARAWAPDPSKRPTMSQLVVALQHGAEQCSATSRPTPEPPTLPVGSGRILSGSRRAAGAVIIVLAGALAGVLVGATNAWQSPASFENLQRNTSTLVRHARDDLFSPAADKATAQPVPKPTLTPAKAPPAATGRTHPATASATPTPKQATTLAAANPGLFSAGPVANEPIIGRLAFPRRGTCSCSAYTQVKLKAEITNESSGPIEAALGGASAKIPTGPYLVFTASRSATWKAEPGAGVTSIRYPIDQGQPVPGRDDVVLVPANPDNFYRKISALEYTFATHWATQTVAAGHTYRNPAHFLADLVFTSPSGEAWTARGVIWVTDHGVLVGPMADWNAEPWEF